MPSKRSICKENQGMSKIEQGERYEYGDRRLQDEVLPALPDACHVFVCLRIGLVAGCPARCVCACPISELDDLTCPVPGTPWNRDELELERELGSVDRDADGAYVG